MLSILSQWLLKWQPMTGLTKYSITTDFRLLLLVLFLSNMMSFGQLWVRTLIDLNHMPGNLCTAQQGKH